MSDIVDRVMRQIYQSKYDFIEELIEEVLVNKQEKQC